MCRGGTEVGPVVDLWAWVSLAMGVILTRTGEGESNLRKKNYSVLFISSNFDKGLAVTWNLVVCGWYGGMGRREMVAHGFPKDRYI